MNNAGLNDLLGRGKALHRQGRLAEAAACYRQLLAADAANADALHLLGVIANQQGEHERAVALIGEALRHKPAAEHFHCNMGLALMGRGDLEGARKHFLEELARYPSSHASHVNLGVLLQKQGRQEQAIEHYRTALAMHPGDVMVLNNLGFALMERRELDAAETAAQKSLQMQERNPDALNLLGLLRRQARHPEQALDYFRRAAQFNPGAAEIHFNMGMAHKDLAEYEKAIACYRKALELGGPSASLYNNLGVACSRQGDLAAAMAWYERALEIAPDDASSHFNRSVLLLLNGQFEQGWREYEYGMASRDRMPRFQEFPRWQGEPLDGRTLLVCAEQGIGDEIMFASILPEIMREAGHCVLECDARLVPIYERSFPAATVIRRRLPGEDDTDEVLPPVDVQTPVGSLARCRRNRLEAFPRHAGYLKADAERVAYWGHRLEELGAGLKVGISWRGGTVATGLNRRSIPLAEWLPVLRQAGVQFVSLQYTECREEIAALEAAHGIRVAHWQEAIDDYDETAALVSALDLVLTVQTAVFHLSGALGRPVWGLIAKPSEWRYLQAGDSLPWYPSARMFRQPAAGDWATVIDRVAGELGGLAGGVKKIG